MLPLIVLFVFVLETLLHCYCYMYFFDFVFVCLVGRRAKMSFFNSLQQYLKNSVINLNISAGRFSQDKELVDGDLSRSETLQSSPKPAGAPWSSCRDRRSRWSGAATFTGEVEIVENGCQSACFRNIRNIVQLSEYINHLMILKGK